MKTILGLVKRA